MTPTRRSFIGGAAAIATWPSSLWGAASAGASRPAGFSIWERTDGSATDPVMARRMYLDLAGRIPTVAEAKAYVHSGNPNKREALVETLLESECFADYWTMRFCDILRVKSEFPINLWPNAVYVYYGRVRRFVSGNEPWDRFGRALITSQGSDFRDAEVNFFRATDRRNPEGWAEAIAQTFLAIPPDRLSESARRRFAERLANVKIKNTREWKEEIVYVEGQDRRGELCDILFSDMRSDVADALLSRIRMWIFGPSAPRCASSGRMTVKDILRDCLLSDEYARGSVCGGFPARKLDAEVLDDALCSLSGIGRNYQSPAPEPFTFLPPDRSTVKIEDGSISSGFLSLFGRPARDTGLMDERGADVTAKQRLYLFNSASIHRKINSLARPPWKLPDGHVAPFYRLTTQQRLEHIYWSILSRGPSRRESDVAMAAWKRRSRGGKNRKANFGDVLSDVAWCLLNSKEFIFRV